MITSLFIRKKRDKYIVVCEYRDAATKKKKQKQLASFIKKKEANIFLATEKIKNDRGMLVAPTKSTLFDYLTTWNNSRKGNISVATTNYYSSMIECHYGPKSFLGKLNIQDIKPADLNYFFQEHLKQKGLAENTLAKHFKFLHKAFDDAIRDQILYKNPTEYCIKVSSKKSSIATTLTLDESRALIAAAKGTLYEIPVHLGLALGMRSGEIFALTWDDINFKKNIISITKSITVSRHTREISFKEPKTASSKRKLIMPNEISIILKSHKANQKTNKYNLVITNTKNEPMLPANFSSIFSLFQTRNNLRKVRFHDLRHTNASLNLLVGTSIKVTSKNLGHSTTQITSDLYTHVLEELDTEACEALSSALYPN